MTIDTRNVRLKVHRHNNHQTSQVPGGGRNAGLARVHSSEVSVANALQDLDVGMGPLECSRNLQSASPGRPGMAVWKGAATARSGPGWKRKVGYWLITTPALARGKLSLRIRDPPMFGTHFPIPFVLILGAPMRHPLPHLPFHHLFRLDSTCLDSCSRFFCLSFDACLRTK